jgi:hypothetical protein
MLYTIISAALFVAPYGLAGVSHIASSLNGTFRLAPYTIDDDAKTKFLTFRAAASSRSTTVPPTFTST